jgi:protein-disulfide isomerase/uncharacterized membrane protein
MSQATTRNDLPLPRPGLRWAYLLVTLVGLGLSIELIRLHYVTHTRPAATALCSIAKGINCQSVAESPYAVFLSVPVAVWAALAYGVLAVLTLLALLARGRFPRLTGMHVVLSGVAVLAAAALAAVSHLIIRSLCIYCAGLYGVNTALLILALVEARKQGGVAAAVREDVALVRGRPWGVVGLAAPLLAVAGGLMALFPRYWVLREPVGPGGLPHGTTSGGQAWIGARDPVLTVHEFSDYECGFCRRANAVLREALQTREFRDVVRLVHHHYPLDQRCNRTVPEPFHQRSCELAAGAYCAGRQGKFWEMNDLLFARQVRRGGPDLQGLAGKLGLDLGSFRRCLDAAETRAHVKADIELGEKMAQTATGQGIPGTPAYFVQLRGSQELRPGQPNPGGLRRALALQDEPAGPAGLPSGVTEQGYPWIGAAEPGLVVYELSDYQCTFCREKNAQLRQLLRRTDLGKRVRVVHLQYPFDKACNPELSGAVHPQACELARAAICAKAQGKFWELSDAFYAEQRGERRVPVPAVARRLGLDVAKLTACQAAPETKQALELEVLYAESLGKSDGQGIEGIPSYFVGRPGDPPLRLESTSEQTLRKLLAATTAR